MLSSNYFSLENKKWDFSGDCWVGGRLIINNLSGGFHGLLKQYWEYYVNNKITSINVLLVSENNDTKKRT